MKKVTILFMFAITVFGFSATKSTAKKNNEKTTTTVSKNKSGNYESNLRAKMDSIEKGLQSSFDSGVTSEMETAIIKLHDAWEEELNTIYKLVMNKLPEKEKVKLRNSQREWVKIKEDKAKKAEKEFEGGTFSNAAYIASETEEIKNKTIELAKKYDSLK